MKFAVISDTHVHPWSAFSTGSGLDNTRMAQTLKVMEDAFIWAREKDGLLVHAGDWIHTTGHARHTVTSALWDLLEEYRDVHVATVWGNHDSRGRGSKVTYEETFLRQFITEGALPNFHVLNGQIWEYEGVKFTGLGAQPTPDLLDLDLLPSTDVCILHAMVSGATFPGGTVAQGVDPDTLLSKFRLSIVGDIHKPHVHQEDGRFVLIPGSPEHHKFGDKGPHGWWKTVVNKDEVRVEFQESDSPKFLTVENASEIQDDGNFYRIIGQVTEPLPENAKAVAPGPSTVETRDLLAGVHGVTGVLDRWLENNPPPGDVEAYRSVGVGLVAGADVPVPVPCQLQRVDIKNFFSHKETRWTLEEGVHMLGGTSRFYKSNGAGKSVLPESVYWCLTGKTTKGVAAADVIRWGAKKTVVTCRLDLNGQELVVTRNRTKTTGGLTVTLDGKDVEASTNRDLDKVLLGLHGLSPELALSLGYISQEEPVLLSQSTDGQIKSRLQDLSGARVYEEGAGKARELESAHSKEAGKLQGRLEALEEELELAQATAVDHEGKAQEWEGSQEQVIKDLEKAYLAAEAHEESRLATWQVRLAKVGKAIKARKERYREEAQDTEEATKRIAADLTKNLTAKVKEFEEEATHLKPHIPESKSLEEVKQGLMDMQARVKQAQNQKRSLSLTITDCQAAIRTGDKELEKVEERLAELKSGKCPTCGQSVPELHEDIITEAEEEKERLLTKRESVHKRLEEAQELLGLIEDPEALGENVDVLEPIVAAYQRWEDIQEELSQLKVQTDLVTETAKAKAEQEAQAHLAQLEKGLDERGDRIITVMEEEHHHNRNATLRAQGVVEEAKAKENPHNALVAAAQGRVERVEKGLVKAREEQEQARQDAAIAKYWSTALGKSGIQSLLMDQLAAQFNACRGQVFPVLTRGVYDVQFSTTSETQKGELRERTEFQVYQKGVRVPYANLSGGQRRRLDLGVLLTMTMAASRSYGITGAFGVLFLDEVDAFLDEDGAEAMAEVLEEYDAVKSRWVVSQDPRLQSLFSSVYMVEQDEKGVSRLLP